MATDDKRIDELPAVTELDGNSLMILQQNAAAMKMTLQQLLTFLNKNVDAGSAVLFVAQNLTEDQKAQARTNIGAAAPGEGGGGTVVGAVLYTVQTLTEEQQHQARLNIRCGSVGKVAENVKATGNNSHAEGDSTTAIGAAAHAEGYGTYVAGHYSHAEGRGTKIKNACQHVQGEYNILDSLGVANSSRGKYVHIVGNGTADNARSNAHTLDWDGVPWFAGDRVMLGGTGMDDTEAVALMPVFVPQTLTEVQKTQARANIGALADSELEGAVEDALAEAKESGEFDGPKGDPFTYEDFTPEQLESLKGKTPVKGEDYYTPAEKQEMVEAVLAALPVWEGGRY